MLFFFFVMIDLYFLIPVVIAQNFNPTAELVMATGTATNEANAKTEIEPLTAEVKIRQSWKYFKALHTFSCFLLINSVCFISSKI